MTPLEPQLITLLAATAGIGVLMSVSGVHKGLLEWRRRRPCPGCGRPLAGSRCGCR
jgi:hypothetical protein